MLFQEVETLPALSLTQPWTTMMALGAKRIETRSWQTSYRGPLALHAAKSFPEWAEDRCDDQPFQQVLRDGGYAFHGEATHNRWHLPLGQVIAVGILEEVERIPPTFQASQQERALGNYAPGRYAWRFSAIHRLASPIAARGSLGLWTWRPPASFWEEIRAICNPKGEG